MFRGKRFLFRNSDPKSYYKAQCFFILINNVGRNFVLLQNHFLKDANVGKIRNTNPKS